MCKSTEWRTNTHYQWQPKTVWWRKKRRRREIQNVPWINGGNDDHDGVILSLPFMSTQSNKSLQMPAGAFSFHPCFYSSSHVMRLLPLFPFISGLLNEYFKGRGVKSSFLYYWSDLPVRRSPPSLSRETAGHFPGPGSLVCAGYWRASVLVFPRHPSCCSSVPEAKDVRARSLNPVSKSTGLVCVTVPDKDSLCSDMGKMLLWSRALI